MTTATVVIPVHNGAATLGEQLEALASQVGAPPFDVVVVLNCCTDDSRAVAEAAPRSTAVSIIDADARPSSAYARNVGASSSSSDFVLFCDADDRVGSRWVREMLAPLVAGTYDIVGGCPIVDRDGLPSWMYERFYAAADGPHLVGYRGELYAIGASIGCRREAFDLVGGFDESFLGTGGEDIDFALRMVRAGSRIGAAPAATFSYRPVTDLRAQLQRQRAYAQGRAHLHAKELGHVPVPSIWREVVVLVRMVGGLLIRQRQWRPSAYAASLVTEVYWFEARRAVARRRPMPGDRRAEAVAANEPVDERSPFE